MNAAYDYIDTCDKPSEFVRDVKECIPHNLTLAKKICIAFALVKVKEHGEYINGFKEDFFKGVDP